MCMPFVSGIEHRDHHHDPRSTMRANRLREFDFQILKAKPPCATAQTVTLYFINLCQDSPASPPASSPT